MSKSEFEASNEVTVRDGGDGSYTLHAEWGEGKDGSTLSSGNYLDPSDMQALREYFQYQRDERLGRWRSQLDPNWTAVVDERHNVAQFRNDDGLRAFHVDLDSRTYSQWTEELRGIAKEYLESHPAPTPLGGAAEGEAWLIEWYDEGAFQPVLILNLGREFVFRDGSRFKLDHPGVRSARRIWPEVSDA